MISAGLGFKERAWAVLKGIVVPRPGDTGIIEQFKALDRHIGGQGVIRVGCPFYRGGTKAVGAVDKPYPSKIGSDLFSLLYHFQVKLMNYQQPLPADIVLRDIVFHDLLGVVDFLGGHGTNFPHWFRGMPFGVQG